MPQSNINSYWKLRVLLGVVLLSGLLFPISCATRNSNPLHSERYRSEPIVRVQLTEYARTRSAPLAIKGPFQIRSGEQVVARGRNMKEDRIRVSGTSVVIANRPLAGPILEIVPARDGTIVIGDRRYRGRLFVLRANGRLTYVNHLPMEDYLAGVIGCEMSLSWPDSALETQAICARTYALHEMTTAKHNDFDVYDSVKSQVYRGIANDDDRARAMIAKTRGLVLTYQGRVFPTFFSSTCGGHTASAELAFGGPKIPPLSGRPCEACKISKYYRWSRNLDKSTIEKKLRAAGATIPGPLSSIQIVQAGPSGHARTVELKGASGSTTWPATRFRMAVGPGTQGILSTRFQTLDRGDTIDFEGGGWGHGVGLCQMGTLGLARDGVPCDRICRFYYPGALIRRFW